VKSYRYAAITLLLGALGLGCASAATKTAASAGKSAPAAARGKQASMPDAELEKAIRARFAASKIASHHFQVHVQGGVATLEGQTDVLQHKGTATRLAKNVGAVRVVNRIEVSQAARDKAAGNLAKGRRRAQVKRSESTARSEKRSL
jgi:osmotically-inducible protein OsmY